MMQRDSPTLDLRLRELGAGAYPRCVLRSLQVPEPLADAPVDVANPR